jgi:hypothetical protein
MDDNRLRTFGLGFAIFGFGLNLAVKIAASAPINWQPSMATAVFLLVLSCASIIVGLSIVAYSLVPPNIRGVTTALWQFIREQRQFVVLWLIAILIVGLMGWQSISLYQLQSNTGQRRLTSVQKKAALAALATASDPSFIIHVCVISGHPEASNYASDFASVLQQANVKYGEEIQPPPGYLAFPSIDPKTHKATFSPTGTPGPIAENYWLENIGLTMFVSDLVHKPNAAVKLVNALENAGLTISWRQDIGTVWGGNQPPVWFAPLHFLASDECYLLVGLRAPD